MLGLYKATSLSKALAVSFTIYPRKTDKCVKEKQTQYTKEYSIINIQETFKKTNKLSKLLQVAAIWGQQIAGKKKTSVTETILAFHTEMLAVQLFKPRKGHNTLCPNGNNITLAVRFLQASGSTHPQKISITVFSISTFSVSHIWHSLGNDAHSPNQLSCFWSCSWCFLQCVVTKMLWFACIFLG